MNLIGSGMLYVSVFLCSAGCFALVDHGFKRSSRTMGMSFLRIGMLLIGIMLPSLLAGMRANEVGVDVNVYVVPNMLEAYTCDSFAEVHAAIGAGSEYLYAFLVYFFSRFTRDAGMLLFSMQFLTIAPIVAAIGFMRRKMHINISTSLAMLVYFFCYFNNSLNMMRQSVACAFIILGSVHLLGSNCRINRHALLNYLLAAMFHKGALIGILVSFVLIFISSKKVLNWVKVVAYAAIILIPVLLTGIIELLIGWGLLPERFIWYTNVFIYGTVEMDDWFINPFSPMILADVLFRTVLVLVPYVFCARRKDALQLKGDHTFVTIRSMVTMAYLMYVTILYSMNTVYGGRLSLFIEMFSIVLLPYAVLKSTKKGKSIKLVILLGIIVLYWMIWVMRLGWSGSNFYQFRF